jgi:TolB protein
MKKTFNIIGVLLLLFALVPAASVFAQSDLGVFEDHSDIGKPGKAGAAVFVPETGQYLIAGGGYNIWFGRDEAHWAYRKIKGDFIVYARARFVGARGIEEHRKFGWMARSSTDSSSANVNVSVHGDGLTALQFRKEAGAAMEEKRSALNGADVIQLERKGNTYTMRAAKFGEPFIVDHVENIDLGEELLVGLFTCSHNTDVLETSVFQDVRITIPAPDSLVPYRQYLGSDIELLDVLTGSRKIVYSSTKSLQAPNWLADGKSLVYNSDGLIYKLTHGVKEPTVVPTGSVKNNNNDHVLSFDGKILGLSSGVQSLGGSIIYTVPVTGGQPKQVTPKGPSYLHGWSPDGKYLVFTGQRNNEYDIYRVPANGGKEERLTTAKGLDDGPEYSPDGKTIYFNSSRNGTMQIWRMNTDGSNQVALTDTSFHDWFPHVSPDGKTLVFLSFLKEEVGASDHPFYKHVYIRMMPIAGGKPTVIAYVYGGQGTINTPSWSPDGKRLAFVSNTAR